MNPVDLQQKIASLSAAHEKTVSASKAEIAILRKEIQDLRHQSKVASDNAFDIEGLATKVASDLVSQGYLPEAKKKPFVDSVLADPQSLIGVCSKIASFGTVATEFSSSGEVPSGDDESPTDKAWNRLNRFVRP